MPEPLARLTGWLRDLALAYAGGLVLGAPVAAVAGQLSGVQRLSTLCLLLTMVGVLVALRRQSSAGADASALNQPAGTSSAPPDDVAPGAGRRGLSDAA